MWYGSTRDDIRLVKIDLFITARCSLRCRRCSNLMQYYTKPEHESFEDIALGLKQAFDLIDYTESMFILGGEPTLHPNLKDILLEAAKYRHKIGSLLVVSNGLTRLETEIVKILRELNIPVNISLYPSFASKQSETARELEAQGVSVELFDPCWTARTQKEDNNGSIFYKDCRHMVAPCATLRGTQFWYCEFACNAHALGCEGDYIDLTLPTDKEKVYEYLDPQEPLSACKHCSGGYSDICIEAGSEQCPEPLRWEA